MTLQFRQKAQDNSFEELQKEVKLLRDYNSALEKQNESRNEQRKVLHAEIDRLLAIERDWKKGTSVQINIKETREYIEIYSQYSEIKTRYQALLVQNKSLMSKSRVTEASEAMLANIEKQKSGLELKIRNYEMKIYTLQAQVVRYESELAEYRKKDEESTTINRQFFSFQTKIDEFQRQLQIKTQQIAKYQREAQSKEDIYTREVYQLKATVEDLEQRLRIRTDEVTRLQRQGMTKDQSLLTQTVNLQTKNDQLVRQLSQKTEELSKLSQNQVKRETYSSELIILQSRYDEQVRLLQSKGEELLNLQRVCHQKDEELSRLRLQIGTYSSKINLLSDELDRLQRTHKSQIHTQTIKYVERESEETILLRSKVEQLISSNNSLSVTIASLNQDIAHRAQYINDLERRIDILEDTNRNLEKELRVAIENRKAASRVTYAQDQGLKETITTLKAELNEVISFNKLVRQENDELYSQLELARTHNHHFHHSKHVCRQRSRSKSPVSYSRKADRPYNQRQSNTQMTFYQHPENASRVRLTQTTSPLSSTLYKSNTTSNLPNERYNDLQRKIRQLQSENESLKQHLVFQI